MRRASRAGGWPLPGLATEVAGDHGIGCPPFAAFSRPLLLTPCRLSRIWITPSTTSQVLAVSLEDTHLRAYRHARPHPTTTNADSVLLRRVLTTNSPQGPLEEGPAEKKRLEQAMELAGLEPATSWVRLARSLFGWVSLGLLR